MSLKIQIDMNLYNYIFYRIYKTTSRINNIFPEFSTSIYLSILIFINILSIILFMEIPLDRIGLNNIYIGLTIIYVVNHLYFINKNRYKKIVENFDKKENSFFLNLLILIYPYVSFFLLFKTLKIDNISTFVTIGILILIDIIALFSSNSDDKSKFDK